MILMNRFVSQCPRVIYLYVSQNQSKNIEIICEILGLGRSICISLTAGWKKIFQSGARLTDYEMLLLDHI